MTGMTTVQTGGNRRNDYVSLYHPLKIALEKAGHTVTLCKPSFDMDLTPFDCALIGVHMLNGRITQGLKLQAMYVASQLPHAMVLDDWQVDGIRNSMTSSSIWSLGCVDIGTPDYETYDRASSHYSDEIERIRAAWQLGSVPIIAPLFNWGDAQKFADWWGPNTELRAWDPSPIMNEHFYFGIDGAEKSREWVCAALLTKDVWLSKIDQCAWPIRRRYKGQVRVPERELIEVDYGACWGVLAPFYPKLEGMGWWRSRYNFAVQQSGCVMWADPREVDQLGMSFGMPIDQIEALPEELLVELNLQQAGRLKSFELSYADSVECAGRLVEGLV